MPRSSSSSQTAANWAEFRLTMGLRSRTANGLHGGFIGDKLKNGARNFAGDAIQKIQGKLNAVCGMVRHEAAGKKFRCRAGELLVAASMRQQIDPRQRRAIGRSNAGIAMPGRAVHPDLAVLLAQD